MHAPLLVALTLLASTGAPPLMDGDLIFQESRSALSEAVEAATGSELTHMGIVTLVDGKPHVYEASGPVGLAPLRTWIKRGVGERYWVKRLRDRDRVLTPKVLGRMKQVALSFKGRPYDHFFQWDKERFYCSELVHDIYLVGAGLAIGRVQQIGDLDLSSRVVQRLIRKRFHRTLKKRLDEQELIITPVAMFEDPRLVTVIAPN